MIENYLFKKSEKKFLFLICANVKLFLRFSKKNSVDKKSIKHELILSIVEKKKYTTE